MKSQSDKSKKIAKNTLFLYIRMILVMIVSLYISRVVLNTLGVEDYGILNVVGGFVSMFSLISGSIGTSIVRFLTYELGREDKDKLAATFSTSINIQIATIIIIVIIAETFGLWFLNYKMTIPAERMIAANWVFQLSLASFCLGLINVPYNSIIVAYERMDVFAYFNILEVLLKLAIVCFLVYATYDKLIIYNILLLFIALLIRYFYYLYCRHNFPESRYRLFFDLKILKEMGKFTGWNYLGACALILRSQGLNILMNLFFGVTVNAARGIATQVETAVGLCIQNLALAISPQITKSFAQNNKDYMRDLICYGAKYTYLMVFIIIIPLLFETPLILNIWLKGVPDFTVIFTRLTLLLILSDCLSNTLTDALLASGDIKKLQIMAGCVVLQVFPLSYILFSIGFPSYSCYVLCIIALIVKFVFEVYYVRTIANMSFLYFFNNVLIRAISSSVFILVMPATLVLFYEESIARMIYLSISSTLWSFVIIYLFGLSKSERLFIIDKVRGFLK